MTSFSRVERDESYTTITLKRLNALVREGGGEMRNISLGNLKVFRRFNTKASENQWFES